MSIADYFKQITISLFLLLTVYHANAKEHKVTIKGETLKNASLANETEYKTTVSGIQAIVTDRPEQIVLELQDFLPLDGAGLNKTVVLNEINVLSPDAKIYAGTKESDIEITIPIAIYRGKISDTESVNICFTPKGAVGHLQIGNKYYSIKPDESEPYNISYLSHLIQEIKAPACGDDWCTTDVSNISDDIKKLMAKSGKPQMKSASTPLIAKLAVETDYETYVGFGKDSLKTAAWMLSVIANSSQIFEQEINVKLEVSYLKVWTTSDDPYSEKGYFLFDEFNKYLANNLKPINRDGAILLIKDPSRLSGGMSTLDKLGDTDNALLVTGEFALTHELGHLFGSPHTHACYWPAGPGGTLGPIDQCATVEGNCGITEIISQEGTIMSYCYPKKSVFGPYVRNLLQARTGLKLGNIPPPVHKITGRVTTSGAGLSLAQVIFYNSENEKYEASTNENGEYQITLPDNSYSYRASHEGYIINIEKSSGMLSSTGGIYLSEKTAVINFEAFELNKDQFEPDDNLLNAVNIEPDGTLYKHSNHTVDDTDYMKFNAIKGKTYYIVCNAERNLPPGVWLFGEDGITELASTSGIPGVMIWKTESSGLYYLKVWGSLGDYTISVSNAFYSLKSGVQAYEWASTDWGDYDNDGDLDLLISGMINFEYRFGLFNFTNGIFSKEETSFISGSYNIKNILNWVDYDNDNDLDILVANRESSAIYVNEKGNFQSKIEIAGNQYGEILSVDEGDYDNDGDVDFLIQNLSVSEIQVIKNSKNSFEKIVIKLSGTAYGKLKWIDYDSDGDLDIVAAGSTSGNSVTGAFFKIYKNEFGEFSDANVTIDQLTGDPDFDFGDYDNDGDLDLVVSGIIEGKLNAKIFRFDYGTYSDIKAPIIGLRNASLAWGDYDNDGDLDLISSGQFRLDAGASAMTKLYENKQGEFSETPFSPALLQIIGTSNWTDINRDNALDLLLVGEAKSGKEQLDLLLNENNIKNDPPSPPNGLKAITEDNILKLEWLPSTDDKTPSNGLTYNIRVGTTPGGSDILAPNSDLMTGLRKIIKSGNVGNVLKKSLQGLKSGKYYWSVQAIDHSFSGSAWANEQSFYYNVNKAPVANAGADQSVNEGTKVTLDGSSSSDPDGNTITYKWTAPAGITLSSTTVAKPTFTAPEVTANTNYIFSLVVNDGMVDSPADEVLITVRQVNKAPVAKAGADQSVNEGVAVSLDGAASTDPDGNPLTYKWTAPVGITLSSTTAQKPTFTAPEVSANTDYTFTLVVNDGMVDSQVDQIVVTVKQVNKAPVAKAGADQSVNEGVAVSLDGAASTDPDGNPLTYKWTAPVGITLSSTTAPKPTFTAPEVSTNTDYFFSLIVNDGMVDSPADQVVITVKQVNKAPVANAGADQSMNEGTTVSLDGSLSSDPDKDNLIYSWSTTSNVLLSDTESSKPTFIAPEVKKDSVISFSLKVSDGKITSDPATVKITVLNVIKVGNSETPTLAYKVYPNPTTGELTLEFTKNFGKKSEVSVSNLIGAEVFRKELNHVPNCQIDLSNQVSGIYLLKVIVDNQQYISKIVIRKE